MASPVEININVFSESVLAVLQIGRQQLTEIGYRFKNFDPIALFSGTFGDAQSRFEEARLPSNAHFFRLGQEAIGKLKRKAKYLGPPGYAKFIRSQEPQSITKKDVEHFVGLTNILVQKSLSERKKNYRAYKHGDTYDPYIEHHALRVAFLGGGVGARFLEAILTAIIYEANRNNQSSAFSWLENANVHGVDIEILEKPFFFDYLDFFAALALRQLDDYASHYKGGDFVAAANALAFADRGLEYFDRLMDQAHGIIKAQFIQEGASLGKKMIPASGGKAKGQRTEPLRKEALRLYEEKRYPSTKAAAKIITPQIHNLAQQLGIPLSEYSGEDTVYRWLRVHGKHKKNN